MTLFEIFEPSLKRSIDIRDDRLDAVTARTACFAPYFVFKLQNS